MIGVSAAVVVLAIAVLVLQAGGDDNDGSTPSSGDVTTTATATEAAPSATQPVTPTATPGTSSPTGQASGPANHDAARAMANVAELAKEPRVSGSPAEGRAAQWIAEQFRSYGYSTEIMEFEFDGDRFRAGETRADGKTFGALTLAGSIGGTVDAVAAYVGLADAAGIGVKDLTGKIAVADRGTLNFSVKYANVKQAGAVGLIVVNNQPGPFSGNLTTESAFPVVGVSREDGAAILDASKNGRKVGITAPGTAGLTKALNVVAKATTESTCRLLVGGHFDSVPGAPGANDNASGAANVIELARASAVDGVDNGLCFATFGAEESGLYGSKALVQRFQDESSLPKYMINLDVTGIGKGVEVIGDSGIAADAIALAKALGISAVKSQLPANSGSDHESFVNAGVETVFLTSGDFSTIHTPQDVTADIQQSMLDQVGDTALAIINRLLPELAQG
jgi:Iap family predicted aminopeptidase